MTSVDTISYTTSETYLGPVLVARSVSGRLRHPHRRRQRRTGCGSRRPFSRRQAPRERGCRLRRI